MDLYKHLTLHIWSTGVNIRLLTQKSWRVMGRLPSVTVVVALDNRDTVTGEVSTGQLCGVHAGESCGHASFIYSCVFVFTTSTFFFLTSHYFNRKHLNITPCAHIYHHGYSITKWNVTTATPGIQAVKIGNVHCDLNYYIL